MFICLKIFSLQLIFNPLKVQSDLQFIVLFSMNLRGGAAVLYLVHWSSLCRSSDAPKLSKYSIIFAARGMQNCKHVRRMKEVKTNVIPDSVATHDWLIWGLCLNLLCLLFAAERSTRGSNWRRGNEGSLVAQDYKIHMFKCIFVQFACTRDQVRLFWAAQTNRTGNRSFNLSEVWMKHDRQGAVPSTCLNKLQKVIITQSSSSVSSVPLSEQSVQSHVSSQARSFEMTGNSMFKWLKYWSCCVSDTGSLTMMLPFWRSLEYLYSWFKGRVAILLLHYI